MLLRRRLAQDEQTVEELSGGGTGGGLGLGLNHNPNARGLGFSSMTIKNIFYKINQHRVVTNLIVNLYGAINHFFFFW